MYKIDATRLKFKCTEFDSRLPGLCPLQSEGPYSAPSLPDYCTYFKGEGGVGRGEEKERVREGRDVELPIQLGTQEGMEKGKKGSLKWRQAILFFHFKQCIAVKCQHVVVCIGNMMTLSYSVGLTTGSAVAYLLNSWLGPYSSVDPCWYLNSTSPADLPSNNTYLPFAIYDTAPSVLSGMV